MIIRTAREQDQIEFSNFRITFRPFYYWPYIHWAYLGEGDRRLWAIQTPFVTITEMKDNDESND